jgi:hypothetical protein
VNRINNKINGGIIAASLFLSSALPMFAVDDATQMWGVNPPDDAPIVDPTTSVGGIVTFAVAFIIVIAVLAAVLFIVIGAFQWITSGGDKQKVADARNHILAAVIGLIIIALSFVIINVITTALGIGPITDLKAPKLGDPGYQ